MPSSLLPDSSKALDLVKPSVRAESAYSLEAPAAPRKLNQNESPWDVPEDLKEAIQARVARAEWRRYPAFVPRELIAALGARHDWPADGVLVGNGSNELIQATLSVALGTGDVAVAPAPTFALYRLITAVMGARYFPVPMAEDFTIRVEALIAAAREERARVVVVNSPNNPTGSVLPDDGVSRLLAGTESLVVCDEAYQDFGGPSAVGLLRRSARLVVLRTFSKAMGLAGLRFGYALMHPDLAREIAKAKLPYNVNLMTLAAAEVVLAQAARFRERVAAIVTERDGLLPRLGRIPGIRVFPSAANFVLIRCEARPAKEIFTRLVTEHGILVRDVSSGAGLRECLRITVGTKEDNDAVVAALGGLFGGKGS